MSFQVPNQHRIRKGYLASSEDAGNNGAFHFIDKGVEFFCIASDGSGWEHVSVSINRKRTPSWEQMCFVKEMFWRDPEDCVIQYHPPMSRYVNNAEFCLHLWRPVDCGELPFPPTWMV